jgi:hypothetical protein
MSQCDDGGADLGAGVLVDALTAYSRVEAWAAAGKATMICSLYDAAVMRHRAATAAEVAAGARPVTDEADVDLEVTTEVALALGLSPRVAAQLIWFARDLAEHPALLMALATGKVDEGQAQVILTGVRELPAVADRAEVVARLVGPAPGEPDRPLVRELRRPGALIWQLTAGRLRGIVAREVHEVDAEAARRAAELARDRRRVWQRPVEHSMGELTVHGAAEETSACWASIDDGARAARASGDARSLDQLRADIAVGRLSLGLFGAPPTLADCDAVIDGGAPAERGSGRPVSGRPDSGSRPRILVNLTMAVETHLGLDDRPATLHSDTAGPIPLPAHIARALARDPDRTFLRRVLTAPATGVAWDVSGRYRPSAAMAAFVAARDGYRSRLPVSGASRIETDHVVAYDHARPPQGGPTTPSNLQSLGHRDHRWKTIGTLRVTGNANDVLEIRTPAGKTYLSYPEPYHDPEPPQPPLDSS